MNKYVISVKTSYPKRYDWKVEYKYLAEVDSLTETVECAMVGKKITMKRIMKSLAQAHRAADRVYAAKGTIDHYLHHHMRLVKYEKAYGRESVQRIIED